MNTYKVAYLNWHSKDIQFSKIEADTGLSAMKELDGIYKLNHILDEELYFREVEKRGGFVAYALVDA